MKCLNYCLRPLRKYLAIWVNLYIPFFIVFFLMEIFGLTLTQIVSILGLFVLGLLVGILIRRLLGVALVLLAIVILAIALGYLSPSTLVTLLHYAGYAMSTAYVKAKELIGAIPYSSLAFIIGLIIGLIKG